MKSTTCLLAMFFGLLLALALEENASSFEFSRSPLPDRELLNGSQSVEASYSLEALSADSFSSSLLHLDRQFVHTSMLGAYDERSSMLNGLLLTSLNDTWNLAAHAQLPSISNEQISNRYRELSEIHGYGDTTLMLLFTPAELDGSFFWGWGPVLSLPTANVEEYGSGTWLAGPVVAAFYSEESWLFGLLSQHRWSMSNVEEGKPGSQTMLQHFIQYTLSDRLQIGMVQSLFLNWTGESQTYSFPFNLEMAKTVKIGKYPVKFSLDGFFEVTANYKF